MIDWIYWFHLHIPHLQNLKAYSVDTHPGRWFTWHWRLWGFGYATETSGRHLLVKIPYWSIVVPLIFLSAYLLLSKPRSSAQSATEPT